MKIKSTRYWITDGAINGKRVGHPSWHYWVNYQYETHRKQKDGSHKIVNKVASISNTGDLPNWRLKLIFNSKQLERVCRRRFLFKLAKNVILHKNA